MPVYCADIGAESIYAAAKKACGTELIEKQISREECYLLGFSGEEYDMYVKEAYIFTEKCGISGYEAVIIISDGEASARKAYGLLEKYREWMPCDPAEKMIFCGAECFSAVVKGSARETDSAAAEFETLFCGNLRDFSEKTQNID